MEKQRSWHSQNDSQKKNKVRELTLPAGKTCSSCLILRLTIKYSDPNSIAFAKGQAHQSMKQNSPEINPRKVN